MEIGTVVLRILKGTFSDAALYGYGDGDGSGYGYVYGYGSGDGYGDGYGRQENNGLEIEDP